MSQMSDYMERLWQQEQEQARYRIMMAQQYNPASQISIVEKASESTIKPYNKKLLLLEDV